MKSNAKSKIMILIILGILFALAPMITINPSLITGNNNVINLDNKYLKISEISGKIHIINNSGWVDFKNAGNCTGSGTYSDPYVIEDLVIDAGGSGNCILIENSNVYFKIENCTLYNAGWGSDAGIRLLNVNNSLLIGNDCSSSYLGIDLSNGSYNNTIAGNGSYNNTIAGNIVHNNGGGIHLFISDNNTISGNTVNNNLWSGIYLIGTNYTIISGNTMNDNDWHGIQLHGSNNNTISGNTMNDNNMLGIRLELSNNNTISGNTMNGNNMYGIALVSSNNNIISGNTANNNLWSGIYLIGANYTIISGNTMDDNNINGITLESSNNNIISGNTMDDNNINGIQLESSNNNIISGNTANNNRYGIYLYTSSYNTITGNTLIGNVGPIIQVKCQGNIILDNEYGKIPEILIKIHIINNSGWVDFRNAGNCTGSGTYSDPYVIEDLVIDGGGGFGSPIWIENSNVYFKIENCTVYNSIGIWNDAGIRLLNVNNSQLIDNDCSSNSNGILLYECFNNTISGNTMDDNTINGIQLYYSDNNTISGNTANDNEYGIYLYTSSYNTITGNNLIGNDECILEVNCQGNIIQDNDCTRIIPSLNYFPTVLIISIILIGVSGFIIYQNGKKFKKVREELEFL